MDSPPITIEEWIKDSYDRAYRKGWHTPTKTFGEELALFHSEVSEALEEYRNGHHPTEVYYRGPNGVVYSNRRVAGPATSLKPEGVPIELADILIRVFDTCGKWGIDLRAALEEKSKYNEGRSIRHGGKVL